MIVNLILGTIQILNIHLELPPLDHKDDKTPSTPSLKTNTRICTFKYHGIMSQLYIAKTFHGKHDILWKKLKKKKKSLHDRYRFNPNTQLWIECKYIMQFWDTYVSKCMYVYMHISLFLPECACTTIIDISPRIFKLIYCCCVSIIIVICIVVVYQS